MVYVEFVAVVGEGDVDSCWVAVAVVGNRLEAMDAGMMKRTFEGQKLMGDCCWKWAESEYCWDEKRKIDYFP